MSKGQTTKKAQESRRVIVVLGPGRSGTSLVMQVLEGLGMEISSELIASSGANPEGFYEDAGIVELHKALIKDLDITLGMPLPHNWEETEAAQRGRRQIRELLQDRLSKTSGTWGFKDPRTNNFLPLWSRAFNGPGVVPIYILALRDPQSILASLRSQVSRSDALNELLWLQRTTDALYYSGGNCFIAHYEDWFDRPGALAKELLKYTGLEQSFAGDAEAVAKQVISSALNRAAHQKRPEVANRCVRDLYAVLKDCRGADFDHDKVMEAVNETRETMEAFRPWYDGQEGKSNKTVLNKQMERDLQTLNLENSRYLRELKNTSEEVEQLRAQVADLRVQAETVTLADKFSEKSKRKRNKKLKKLWKGAKARFKKLKKRVKRWRKQRKSQQA